MNLRAFTVAALFSLTIALDAQPVPDAAKPPETAGAWVDLLAAASGWKATVTYDTLTGTGHILRGLDLVRFKVGFPLYSAGAGRVLKAPAVRDAGSRLEIPREAVASIASWFSERDAERASRFSIAAILIDPGHGGKDSGAIAEFGSGKDRLRILEKDVVLSIAGDVFSRLQDRWPDKRILITRSGDTFPSLDARVGMANEISLGINEAIIYVSIHANASFNKSASGYEVWYLNPDYRRTVVDSKKSEGVDENVLPILNAMLEEEYTTESVFLARSILGGLKGGLGDIAVNRGLREEEWFVVRNAKMPSVLVEVGFVTNEAEARKLSDTDHLRKLGDGIYNGIVDFVDYFEHRKGLGSP
jgi:N-acetylmuramoyl-L-alanine amidase